MNVGHLDLSQVSKCSALDRAVSSRTLLERVWMADSAPESMLSGGAFRARRAPLAVAREALFAGQQDLVRAALDIWRRHGVQERHARACSHAGCASTCAGRLRWARCFADVR